MFGLLNMALRGISFPRLHPRTELTPLCDAVAPMLRRVTAFGVCPATNRRRLTSETRLFLASAPPHQVQVFRCSAQQPPLAVRRSCRSRGRRCTLHTIERARPEPGGLPPRQPRSSSLASTPALVVSKASCQIRSCIRPTVPAFPCPKGRALRRQAQHESSAMPGRGARLKPGSMQSRRGRTEARC